MRVSPQRRAFFRHLNFKKWARNVNFLTFLLPNVRFATAACIFPTSELQKVVPECQFFNIFTSKCAFRHSGAHFFDIRTYKKWSRNVNFLTFSLPNVPFATGACIFSTSALTKVVQTRHVLYIFTSQFAFRHSGVQFLIYPLTTWLRTRRFNRPTFRLTRHTNHWKNTAFRVFSNI